MASVIESSVFIRSKPQYCQTHHFQKLFGVDSACWEEATSFIPRSVLSLVPSDTIAKHTSFNGFLGLTHHVGKRWLLSFQDKLISLHRVWINSIFQFFHQIWPSMVASTLLIPTLISLKKLVFHDTPWMLINVELISTTRTLHGGYYRANFIKIDPLRTCMHASQSQRVKQILHKMSPHGP